MNADTKDKLDRFQKWLDNIDHPPKRNDGIKWYPPKDNSPADIRRKLKASLRRQGLID